MLVVLIKREGEGGERRKEGEREREREKYRTPIHFSRLHDLSHLLILYPNEPKDKIFGKYYTPMPSKSIN